MFFLLIVSTFLFCASNVFAQLTFSPIVSEIALKIVEECLYEYRKMVEDRPYIKIISGLETEAHPAFKNYLGEFKYLWVDFHAVLNKVLRINTPKNYQQIENSCQMSEESPVVRQNGTIQLMLRPESLFCDFGKKFAFVKHYFVELKRQVNMEYKFITEASEMLKKMEVAYEIGWGFAGRNAELEIRKLAGDVQMALGQIKFRHQFEAVDKNWAQQQMFTQLAENCKKFVAEENEKGTNRKNTFQLALNALNKVPLEENESKSNQTQIDGTCAALYKENMLKNMCVFAKKLAYLSKFRQIYGFAPPAPTSFGLNWLLKRKRNKSAAAKNTQKVDECLERMREVYKAEVTNMGKNFWGTMKQQFMAKLAFERNAKGVAEEIEAMTRAEEERRRRTTGGGRSSTSSRRRSRGWPWEEAARR
ncbi:hypothetical protein niasHT_037917 [Heterodera trifolii]|uniref:Uncharacterized protein n=1 Tax=Heterodera trifolii TaxID=157864 RepID=A0ABD2HND0_9BILA